MHTLNEGGAMGAAMRAHDWTHHPLGPVEQWPQALKTATTILLSSKFPMFLAWGEDLTFLYNDSYSDILGDKHPALGRPFHEVWHDIWSDISPIVQRAMAGEATFFENLPLTMTRRGFAEQTWFTFSYNPLRDEDGSVRGMFCACQETTSTVLAERNRQDEVDRLRDWFDRAPGFMAVVRGPTHRFEVANSAYLQLVGQRDVIGKTVQEALPEVAEQGFIDLLDSVYRTGQPFVGCATPIMVRPSEQADSISRVLDFIYQPIRDPDGSVGGIFVSGYDVTERHQAEGKLRESEERFRLIANSAPVPMWVSNLDRTRDFVNHAYLDFLGGMSETEAKRLDWREILHPDDLARVVAESVAGEASLTLFNLEGRYRNAAGAWRWLRSTSRPRRDSEGNVTGFIGVAHDITEAKEAETTLRGVNEELERRVAARTADLTAALERLQEEVGERERAEEALRQAQKMEAVGRLTGGIAHDFNNLLTPIIGGLELVARKVDDPRSQRLIEAALESGRRGAKLATQLLAFSRVQRIAMSPVPVNRVIEDMGRILHHTIGGDIAVRHDLGADVGHALCDANQLENAILNLAINARDAMAAHENGGGGCLTICTAVVEHPEGPDLAAGFYVCITVADTGQGMPPEVAARAMEPFFSTKPVGKGTGLGLAQVYGIARQSGGTVRIETAQGAGTKVHLLLPQVDAPSTHADRDEGAAPALEGHAPAANILVIDDDRDVRDFLTHALIDLGHHVVACDCAEAGLERLTAASAHEPPPDLVLLDFAMPGMNGAELARHIRARHAGQRIVFVTGYAESEQLEAQVGDKVPVLRKPFTVSELADAIAAARAG